MRRSLPVFLCAISVFAGAARSQQKSLEPLRAPAGTVLTFYLQTRLHPDSANAMDSLPKGTTFRVKLQNAVDSGVNRDGSAFRGTLVSPLLSENNEVIVNRDAEVRGLLALLRSRAHPDGFRYELLVTSVAEKGRAYSVTASLRPSMADGGASSGSPAISAAPPVPEGASGSAGNNTEIPRR